MSITRTVKIAAALAAAIVAVFVALLLPRMEWGTCTRDELVGQWHSPDSNMRLHLGADGKHSMDFKNQRQQWVHVSGTWEFDIDSDGYGRLGLDGFPVRELFYFDWGSVPETPARTAIVAPEVWRRLLSGACIISFSDDEDIWMEKTGNAP